MVGRWCPCMLQCRDGAVLTIWTISLRANLNTSVSVWSAMFEYCRCRTWPKRVLQRKLNFPRILAAGLGGNKLLVSTWWTMRAKFARLEGFGSTRSRRCIVRDSVLKTPPSTWATSAGGWDFPESKVNPNKPKASLRQNMATVLHWIQGNFVWRGVWQGRVFAWSWLTVTSMHQLHWDPCPRNVLASHRLLKKSGISTH